jgi:hypothetical protein
MSAICGLQEIREEIELLVGPALAPGIPDAEEQDVNGRDQQEQQGDQGHHQAAWV